MCGPALLGFAEPGSDLFVGVPVDVEVAGRDWRPRGRGGRTAPRRRGRVEADGGAQQRHRIRRCGLLLGGPPCARAGVVGQQAVEPAADLMFAGVDEQAQRQRALRPG